MTSKQIVISFLAVIALCGLLVTGYLLWDTSSITPEEAATNQQPGPATTITTTPKETAETVDTPAVSNSSTQSLPSSNSSTLLVFSKTSAFRHDSIPAGIAMFNEFADTGEFTVDFSEDSTIFSQPEAQSYDAVVFLNTDSVVFDTEQEKQDFQAFIRSGKGFIGIHGATATHWREDKWDWYKQLIGQRFVDHPDPQQGTVERTNTAHQSTDHLEKRWSIFDEWYNFEENPTGVEVLLTLDETSYEGGTMGTPHPLAWQHTFEGSRSWYTGLGHEAALYDNEDFQKHVLGGVRWVLANE